MDRKYGKIKSERKEFPDDEPLFLLRAQDRFASSVVRYYAMLRSAAGHSEMWRLMEYADQMDKWPVKKDPD